MHHQQGPRSCSKASGSEKAKEKISLSESKDTTKPKMYLSCMPVLLLLACSELGKALPLICGWDADEIADFNSVVDKLKSGLMKYRKELQGELQMADEDLPNPTCPTTLDDTLVGKRMAEYQKCIESAVQFSTRAPADELKQNIIDHSIDLIDKLPGPVWDNVACPVYFSPQSPDPFSSRIESIKVVDCWKQEISSMKNECTNTGKYVHNAHI